MLEETTTIRSKAIFSDDKEHRLLLRKEWDSEKPSAMVIMINPNTADTVNFDMTTMLVLNNVSKLGFGSVNIVNLYSRIMEKLNLRFNGDDELIVDEADEIIQQYAAMSDAIIIAWGTIGKKLFAQVQRIKAKNKRNTGRYHSKEFYLLTGKLVCDVCSKRMIGNLRFSGRSKTRLATYRCNTHRSACNNKELNKDYLDAYIAVLIGERLKPKNLRKAVSKVNQQVQKFNSSYEKYHTDVLQQYNEVQDSLANITKAIEKGIFTDDLLQRAEQLENEKAKLETRLHELKLLEPLQYEDVAYLHTQWKELKRNAEEFRTFIQQFVKAIHVRPYDFDIVLDMGFGVVELTETIPMRRGELYEMFDSKVKEQRICLKNQKADT